MPSVKVKPYGAWGNEAILFTIGNTAESRDLADPLRSSKICWLIFTRGAAEQRLASEVGSEGVQRESNQQRQSL
jgi:hypothetical protein